MSLEQLDRGAEPFHIDSDVAGVLGRGAGGRLHAHTHAHAPAHGHRHVHVDKGDGVETLRRVLHLPDPPEPVERGVVEVEEGVAGGGERVAARVDGRDVVACRMDLDNSTGQSSVFFIFCFLPLHHKHDVNVNE